jgi:hypothetical protein
MNDGMKKQQQVNIDLSKAHDLSCDCGNDIYEMGYKFKKLSAIVSPNGQETVIPIQIFMCSECGCEHEELKAEM